MEGRREAPAFARHCRLSASLLPPPHRSVHAVVEIEVRRARRTENELRLATFPKAPLRSRTVGFPESGSGLGSARHLPEHGPAHECGSSSAGSHTPLAHVVCPCPCPSPRAGSRRIWSTARRGWTGSDARPCSLCALVLRPPSTQGSFARRGRYPRSGCP